MKIAMLGDLALFGRFCIKRNLSLKGYLKSARDFLSQYDVVIANLETPFSNGHAPYGFKSAHIKAEPENVEILKYLNVTHVNLANNHIGDYGPDAYRLTKKILSENGIAYFGIEGLEARLDTSSARVALMGYCSHNTNPLFTSSGRVEGVNILDVDTVLAAMKQNTHDGYLNILSVHSGQEHVHMASLSDIRFARALAGRFDYIYYGHHPHVVQGHEQVAKSMIFYSLGNFLFDDVYTQKDTHGPLVAMSDANKLGLIASVAIQGQAIKAWNTTPIFLDRQAILIGNEVTDYFADEYNKFLQYTDEGLYQELRSQKIADFLAGRRAKRDFNWYWRRLNLASARLIINAKQNARMYKVHFENKLDHLEGKKQCRLE